MDDPKLPLKTRFLNVFRTPLTHKSVDGVLSRATQGQHPESILARIPPSNLLYPRPSIRRVQRDGLEFELDISDFVEWVIYYGIATEPRGKLANLARPGDNVLDIGANVGETTLRFSRRVGPAGKVYCFEPNPPVRAKLERNIALNRFTNIEVMPLGVGDAEATLKLSSPSPHNRGGNRILENPVGDFVEVRVVPLDTLVAEKGIERVDVVKIDVEGFELRALKGGKKTLERWKPILFIEISDETLRGAGTSPSEVLAFVEELGYELRHAETDARLSSKDNFDGQHFDVVCRPK